MKYKYCALILILLILCSSLVMAEEADFPKPKGLFFIGAGSGIYAMKADTTSGITKVYGGPLLVAIGTPTEYGVSGRWMNTGSITVTFDGSQSTKSVQRKLSKLCANPDDCPLQYDVLYKTGTKKIRVVPKGRLSPVARFELYFPGMEKGAFEEGEAPVAPDIAKPPVRFILNEAKTCAKDIEITEPNVNSDWSDPNNRDSQGCYISMKLLQLWDGGYKEFSYLLDYSRLSEGIILVESLDFPVTYEFLTDEGPTRTSSEYVETSLRDELQFFDSLVLVPWNGIGFEIPQLTKGAFEDAYLSYPDINNALIDPCDGTSPSNMDLYLSPVDAAVTITETLPVNINPRDHSLGIPVGETYISKSYTCTVCDKDLAKQWDLNNDDVLDEKDMEELNKQFPENYVELNNDEKCPVLVYPSPSEKQICTQEHIQKLQEFITQCAGTKLSETSDTVKPVINPDDIIGWKAKITQSEGSCHHGPESKPCTFTFSIEETDVPEGQERSELPEICIGGFWSKGLGIAEGTVDEETGKLRWIWPCEKLKKGITVSPVFDKEYLKVGVEAYLYPIGDGIMNEKAMGDKTWAQLMVDADFKKKFNDGELRSGSYFWPIASAATFKATLAGYFTGVSAEKVEDKQETQPGDNNQRLAKLWLGKELDEIKIRENYDASMTAEGTFSEHTGLPAPKKDSLEIRPKNYQIRLTPYADSTLQTFYFAGLLEENSFYPLLLFRLTSQWENDGNIRIFEQKAGDNDYYIFEIKRAVAFPLKNSEQSWTILEKRAVFTKNNLVSGKLSSKDTYYVIVPKDSNNRFGGQADVPFCVVGHMDLAESKIHDVNKVEAQTILNRPTTDMIYCNHQELLNDVKKFSGGIIKTFPNALAEAVIYRAKDSSDSISQINIDSNLNGKVLSAQDKRFTRLNVFSVAFKGEGVIEGEKQLRQEIGLSIDKPFLCVEGSDSKNFAKLYQTAFENDDPQRDVDGNIIVNAGKEDVVTFSLNIIDDEWIFMPTVVNWNRIGATIATAEITTAIISGAGALAVKGTVTAGKLGGTGIRHLLTKMGAVGKTGKLLSGGALQRFFLVQNPQILNKFIGIPLGAVETTVVASTVATSVTGSNPGTSEQKWYHTGDLSGEVETIKTNSLSSSDQFCVFLGEEIEDSSFMTSRGVDFHYIPAAADKWFGIESVTMRSDHEDYLTGGVVATVDSGNRDAPTNLGTEEQAFYIYLADSPDTISSKEDCELAARFYGIEKATGLPDLTKQYNIYYQKLKVSAERRTKYSSPGEQQEALRNARNQANRQFDTIIARYWNENFENNPYVKYCSVLAEKPHYLFTESSIIPFREGDPLPSTFITSKKPSNADKIAELTQFNALVNELKKGSTNIPFMEGYDDIFGNAPPPEAPTQVASGSSTCCASADSSVRPASCALDDNKIAALGLGDPRVACDQLDNTHGGTRTGGQAHACVWCVGGCVEANGGGGCRST